jgi:hypothetical protein
MNKKQLLTLREDIYLALHERKRLGEFDANSKTMIALLDGMLALVDHAIAKLPKEKK